MVLDRKPLPCGEGIDIWEYTDWLTGVHSWWLSNTFSLWVKQSLNAVTGPGMVIMVAAQGFAM